jgi:predicted lipoprotein
MRYIRWISAVLLLAFAGYLLPLFHIHKLDEIERQRMMAQFNPEEFSKNFWKNQLRQSMDQAVSVQALMSLIQNDPEQAKEKYANTIGIGSAYYYYLKGTGYVKSIEDGAVAVVVRQENQVPDLRIITGKIFGNAIRNGCNQLNISDFPNSQEFNQISMYLNKIVENQVLPPFMNKVSIGDRVNFVGCCEVIDEDTDLHPLQLIPITLEIEEGF